MHTHTRLLAVIAALALLAPISVIGTGEQLSSEQEFLITAYYSALPGQCCYVQGGMRADRVLNGEGEVTADGTTVRPGIIAAPESYPFGTRIVLPGIGTFTVHDRGGAIQELPSGDRLDIWAGHGEEGLARALTLGVQRVRGMVYLPGSRQPAESFHPEDLPLVVERLRPFLAVHSGLLDVQPKRGDQGLSVRFLQEHLRTLHSFGGKLTGSFGDETEKALQAFIENVRLTEPTDRLTPTTAAFLIAAADRAARAEHPVPFVGPESSLQAVHSAQRVLRFLGYYHGRTSGVYDEQLSQAILRFQQEQRIVGAADDPGAGRIGPRTQRELTHAWDVQLLGQRARRLLAKTKIRDMAEKRGELLSRFLSEGDSGEDVRLLQRLLVERGFFPVEKINGSFGTLTKQAVEQYQLTQGLIASLDDHGAGVVGSATLRSLQRSTLQKLWSLVWGYGWGVL